MLKERAVFVGDEEDEMESVNAGEDFKQLTQDELDLYRDKKYDYVGKGDPFGNFNRLANVLANYPKIKPDHPLFIAMFGILKHIDCVLDSLSNNRVPNEPLQNRLKDIAVLAKLMIIMLDTSPDIFPRKGMSKEEPDNGTESYDSSSEEDDKESDDESDEEEWNDDDEEEDEDDEGDDETEDDEKERKNKKPSRIKRTPIHKPAHVRGREKKREKR